MKCQHALVNNNFITEELKPFKPKVVDKNAFANFACKRSPIVDFIVAGAQKGGTTALDFYLRQHPEITMANKKEVHFFDSEEYFTSELTDYSLYHTNFDIHQDGIIGESTPIYMYWYSAPGRIWQYNPNMKWIMLLRSPIERAFSHWNMERTRNEENLPFFEAIRTEKKRCRKVLPLQHRVYSYLDRGFYTDQIRRIWHFFPKEQTLFVKSQELKEFPIEIMQKICNFLGLNAISQLETKEVFAKPYTEEMSIQEKDFLQSTFEFEIKELERLLNWDCSEWLID